MKKPIPFFLLSVLIVSFALFASYVLGATGTASVSQAATETGAAVSQTITQTTHIVVTPIAAEYDSEDLDAGVDTSNATTIDLQDDAVAIDGSGATAENTVVTVTAAGIYSISGTLNDGQLVVDTEDEEPVVLVLDGVDITNTTSAPIYVSNAEKVVVTLAADSENYITDGASYIFADAETDEPSAAIFSNDDLTINGSGSLIVTANYNNGIESDDDLKITGGTIIVNAVGDGIKGRDSLAIKDGEITIDAGGDGLQSNNDEDMEKGYVVIEGGMLDITADLDGAQAETVLTVSGGILDITSGGGSTIVLGAESAKGLKAGVAVMITDGTLAVDAADDAIHANDSITIDGGDLTLASGDDAVHADATLTINGGDLLITRSYEGLESAVITINDGSIHLVAGDDGINVAGANDGSGFGGRPGQNQFATGGTYSLHINGGYIVVDAGGDGLDANGSITMSGGVVIVNGPTVSRPGALAVDYNDSFTITGGYLVAVGNAGMVWAPSTSSSQSSLLVGLSSTQQAGTLVHIESEDGNDLLTFAPTKAYQTVLLSSPDLISGETYVVSTDGTATGTASDGLYTDATVSSGSQAASVTLSGTVTTAGTVGGFRGGPGGRSGFGGRP